MPRFSRRHDFMMQYAWLRFFEADIINEAGGLAYQKQTAGSYIFLFCHAIPAFKLLSLIAKGIQDFAHHMAGAVLNGLWVIIIG